MSITAQPPSDYAPATSYSRRMRSSDIIGASTPPEENKTISWTTIRDVYAERRANGSTPRRYERWCGFASRNKQERESQEGDPRPVSAALE